MRLPIVWVIVLKELREALRDQRTLMRLLILPMLVYPMFAIGVSKFQKSEKADREARDSRVALWGEAPAEVRESLQKRERVLVSDWTGAPAELRAGWSRIELPPGGDIDSVEANTPSDQRPSVPVWWAEPDNAVLAAARQALQRREIDAIVAFWPALPAQLEAGGKARVAVYFDQTQPESMLGRERIEWALRLERKRLQAAREASRGLPAGYSMPYEMVERSAVQEGKSGGQILGSVMPMLLLLMSLLGGFMPAIDLTAGEKERGTMQTLLCAPLRPVEIIAGKFVAVATISLLTALLNLISIGLTLQRILPADVVVGARVYVLSALLLVPVNLLFSAMFLALAAFARDFKDGQNVLMPVYLPLTLLSGLASLPGLELDRATSLAPVLNVALLIKALFIGGVGADLVMAVLTSSMVYAALALVLAARVFAQENVLLGGKTSWRELLGLDEGRGQNPGAGFALSAFALAMAATFYGSRLLERAGLIAMFLGAQLGFFLLVPLGVVRLYGFSLQKTYALRRPPVRVVLGAVLMAAAAWAPIGALVTWVAPPPPELVRDLERFLSFGGAPLWAVILLGAVVPAVCEESLFRGLIYGAFARINVPTAIIGSTLLFALAHGSVYRLMPTAVLGLTMGFLRWRSGSIAPSLVFHAINNSLGVTLVYLKPSFAESFLGVASMPPAMILGGLAVFALGATVAFWGPAAQDPTPRPPPPAPQGEGEEEG